MAEEGKTGGDNGGGGSGGGLLDLERELTCSICTDILYQPLTLLDCLHTFCGGCLKEWFAWQAAAAVSNRRRTHPYTCPQCRESVRGTKADWRLTTLLEGFLKANPDRGKTEEEKEEMRRNYKAGEDVLRVVEIARDEDDSEDERMLARVRELSMAHVDPAAAAETETETETARRRAERASRERQRRRQERSRPDRSTARRAQAERAHDGVDRQVEHQPSLRSLLSDSQITSEDVQQEILQSIYSEGLLNDIDIDNLTPQQEEELTERIAEAYRRRQRHRERSRNRDRSSNGEREEPTNRPRQASAARRPSPNRSGSSPPRQAQQQQQQQQQSRARPPISRPHLFEQTSAGAERSQRRSASSTGHHRQRSDTHSRSTNQAAPAARSATDLSQAPTSEDAQRPRPRLRALSSNNRSSTDPLDMRYDTVRLRNPSANLRPEPVGTSPRPRSRDSDPNRRQTGPLSNNTPIHSTSAFTASSANMSPQPVIRHALSHPALAPEPTPSSVQPPPPKNVRAPSICCSRCERPHIETQLHYNCPRCVDGAFNLCLQCYRSGQGCNHWFGFGFAAMHRWEHSAPAGRSGTGNDYPHTLVPRRYTTPSTNTSSAPYPDTFLQEGAFCESCLAFTNDTYWYCEICLQGAWGYCDSCVMQGKHCTHPLVPAAHISARRNPSHDPSKLAFLPLPHLKSHSYVLKPVETYCDICKQQISNSDTRYHCYQCGSGDYDICNTCYHSLVTQGKISSINGPNGWRRCLQNHRMAIISYQNDGEVRTTLRDPVGGWRLKENPAELPSGPPASQVSNDVRYLATWSWWPAEGNRDELAFPKNAEIREGEDLNEDWSVGVYGGRVGVFPRNHTWRV